jgi:predicted esterase
MEAPDEEFYMSLSQTGSSDSGFPHSGSISDITGATMDSMSETLDGFPHLFRSAGKPDVPTFLLLHGTGGNEEDLLPLGSQLARTFPEGANLLSPRGQVLENGMPRFFRRIREGVFDEEDLRFRAAELARFLSAAAQSYSFQPDKVIAAGYSNGANIAAAMLILGLGPLAGGVLFRAMTPLADTPSPAVAGAPIFFSAGQRDPIVPRDNISSLAEALKSAGADVMLHWYSGGHELGQQDLDAATAWLRASKFASD